LTAILLLVFFLPLPRSVVCPFELQPRDAVPVYIDVAGQIVSVDVKQGQHVEKGDSLAQLVNLDINLAIAELQSSIRENEATLEGLKKQSFRTVKPGEEVPAAIQIPAVEKTLKMYQEQLEEKTKDLNRLHLIAPAAGTVLPPPITVRHDDPEEKLTTWSGTPLDPENIGAVMEPGPSSLFCQIGDPKKFDAVLVIDQADRNLVREKQRVDIQLDSYPSQRLRGELSSIAESSLKVVPQRLAKKSGGDVDTQMDAQSGIERPASTAYQARVPMDDPDGKYQIGLRGQARIYTDWVPLGTRLWRLLAHTFNFKL
jgi:putative peptide zinc metalloprotease protein